MTGLVRYDDLRLQVVPLATIEHGSSALLQRAGGDCVSRVVVRRADSWRVVQRTEVAPGDVDLVLRTAAENTFRRELSALDVRDHTAAGVRFRALAHDGNPFVATAMLWPNVLADLADVADILVGAPRQSMLLVRPLFARSDIGTASTLSSVLDVVVRDADDPCSTQVLWWHRGELATVAFDGPGRTPVLGPDLADAVAALP